MKDWLKQNIWNIIGVGMAAIIMLVALSWGKKQTPLSTPCMAIEYDFRDGKQRQYVEGDELTRLLDKEQLYPVDKPLSAIALQSMEQALCNHPMIRTAECFVTPRNIVQVQLTQRVPLLCVQNPDENYFIDTDRRKMEVRATVTDKVLIAKGAISEEMACNQLADFAQWIQSNTYWCERVQYVNMKNPRMMHLYLKGSQQPRIIVGEIDGFRSKMAKLRTFLDNGADATKDKHYTELDLRFADQVVGRN